MNEVVLEASRQPGFSVRTVLERAAATVPALGILVWLRYRDYVAEDEFFLGALGIATITFIGFLIYPLVLRRQIARDEAHYRSVVERAVGSRAQAVGSRAQTSKLPTGAILQEREEVRLESLLSDLEEEADANPTFRAEAIEALRGSAGAKSPRTASSRGVAAASNPHMKSSVEEPKVEQVA